MNLSDRWSQYRYKYRTSPVLSIHGCPQGSWEKNILWAALPRFGTSPRWEEEKKGVSRGADLQYLEAGVVFTGPHTARTWETEAQVVKSTRQTYTRLALVSPDGELTTTRVYAPSGCCWLILYIPSFASRFESTGSIWWGPPWWYTSWEGYNRNASEVTQSLKSGINGRNIKTSINNSNTDILVNSASPSISQSYMHIMVLSVWEYCIH